MATKTRKSKVSEQTAAVANDVPAEEAPKHTREQMTPEETAEFQAAYDAQAPLRPGWTEKENLLIAKLGDSVSAAFKSKVTDSRLATIILERSARVMAQVPTGMVQALTKKDKGKSALMNLVLTKVIQQRDNTQFDHTTKMRMVDLYSQVYGVIPVLYDISVTEHYLGPGSWIVPIRDWFPQPGKLSIEDSDYNFIRTFVSVSWLKKQRGVGSWNTVVLDEVIERASKGGVSPTAQPTQNRTATQKLREPNVPGGLGDAAQVKMITRYENGKEGRWKSYFPDFENLIGRNCANRDGYIPVVLKHHYTLLDSIYGLGAFERGKTLQYAMDSLNAMYLAGVQMSIFPPRIVNPEGVVVESLDYAPAATWTETQKDSIRNYNVSPDGLQTFQATYSWLTGSLLNQNGTTDTSQTVESAADPGAGKTPQALKLQQQRESAADNWDRFQMEKFLQTLYERMINIAKDTPKPFTLHIFDDEIKQLQEAGMSDVLEVFESKKIAKATIGKDTLGGCDYRYTVDAGTSMQQDAQAEHASLSEIITTIVENPMLQYYLSNAGKHIKIDVLIERWIKTGGINYADEIIAAIPQPKPSKALGKGSEGQTEAQPTAANQATQPQAPNPMFAPSRRLLENINYDDLPLWAQVQLLPMAGLQVPPAVQQLAAQQAQNPQLPDNQHNPKPADAPQAPSPTDDPNHEFILKNFDKLSIPAQRAILKALGLPADGILPTEAKIVQDLSSKGLSDSPAAGQDKLPVIDPASPYGAATDPHAHLQGSSDPNVQAIYQAIASHAQKPLEAAPTAPAAPMPPAPGIPAGVK